MASSGAKSGAFISVTVATLAGFCQRRMTPATRAASDLTAAARTEPRHGESLDAERGVDSTGRRQTPLVHALWAEHRLLILIVAAFVAAGGAWLVARGFPWHLTWSYPLVWKMWLGLTAIWVVAQ